jgi:type I restriction enzyme M protein
MATQMSLGLAVTDPISALAEFEQILASNSGEDPFDSAVKLLAAKLVDEKTVAEGRHARFKFHKAPEETLGGIRDLYREAVRRWPAIDANGATLVIEPTHLVRAMRPLLGWTISGSDLTCLDATLERLVARDAKGQLGQYFTPREVIQLCVDVLNPKASDRVVDPACGSGGFLFEASRFAQRLGRKLPHCLGIDFSPRAVRVATLLAAAYDDSRITITCGNSLDGRGYATEAPEAWRPFLSKTSGSKNYRAQTWGDWNRLGCSIVMTNPPFAGEIDEPSVLAAYDSESGSGKRKGTTRECLFLERAAHLLEPGGRMAIVLPQGVLANASASYMRRWLLHNCKLLGVVGLHPFSFLPYTAVKTCVVFVTKPKHGEQIPADYPVFFAISQDSGKDSSGRRLSLGDYSAIGKNFRGFLEREGYQWVQPLEDANLPSATSDIGHLHEVIRADRFDAEYFDPGVRAIHLQLSENSSETIASVASNRVERFKRKQLRDIAYVDITSVDAKTGLAFPNLISAEEAPSRATYLVQPGDVLVSTVRPERNIVALVNGTSPVPRIASNGFCVLRSQSIRPEALFAYCKTETFKKVLSRHATASMYPTVTEKDIMNMPIRRVRKELEDKVADLIASGLSKIEAAHKEIQAAISLLDQESKDFEPGDVKGKSTATVERRPKLRKISSKLKNA